MVKVWSGERLIGETLEAPHLSIDAYAGGTFCSPTDWPMKDAHHEGEKDRGSRQAQVCHPCHSKEARGTSKSRENGRLVWGRLPEGGDKEWTLRG